MDKLPIERFFGTAVIFDVKKRSPAPVTVDDLESENVAVNEDDFVFLNTGWYEKFEDDSYTPHPWLDEAAADWLIERKINLLGLDTITPDIPPEHRPENYEFPIHNKLLNNDILIIENLTNLDKLNGNRVNIITLPVKIRSGDGAPVRVIATIEDR